MLTGSLWDAITVGGNGMAELNSKTKVVEESFARFRKRRIGTLIPDIGLLQFANGTGTYSFAAFLWPEGTLVKVKTAANSYGVTQGWTPDAGEYGWRVIVRLADGRELHVCHENLSKADIPQDVMKLAINQIKAKCPFLDGDRE